MPSCAQLCTRRPRTVLLKLLPRKVASFLVAATALKQKLKDRRGQPLAGGEYTHVPHIMNSTSRTSRQQHTIKPTIQRPSHTLTRWVGKYLAYAPASLLFCSC